MISSKAYSFLASKHDPIAKSVNSKDSISRIRSTDSIIDFLEGVAKLLHRRYLSFRIKRTLNDYVPKNIGLVAPLLIEYLTKKF
jgi:hypothetical protein